jgi:hypothetical protein
MSTAPQTLPANFTGWDQPASAAKPPATLPANFSQWDDQKPAQQPAAAQPQKDFQSRVADRIMGNFDNTGHMIMAIPDAIDQVMSQAKAGTNLPASAADVPAYVGRAFAKGGSAVASMVQKLVNDYTSDPATLVGDLVTAKAFKGVGEEPGLSSAAKPAVAAAPEAATAAKAAPSIATNVVGIASPKLANMMEAVQAGKWEGLVPDRMVRAITAAKQAFPDLLGNKPTAPTETPNSYGTPRSQWGETVGAPGAPFPAKPAPELLQANALSRGSSAAPPNPSDALRSIPVRVAPQPAPTPTPEGAAPSGTANALPQTLNGESALRQVLTGQDNANLLKIAKSRGINVTKEAALKPGTADNLLVNKIVDDFSPQELDEIRAQYLENTRFRHAFGNVGPEAWKTMSLQTYFPDLKIPQAVLNRTSNSIRLSSLLGK